MTAPLIGPPARNPCARCGHDRGDHRHHRPGADCAVCPDGACPEYHRRPLLTRVRDAFTPRPDEPVGRPYREAHAVPHRTVQ